jgi:hypothetical protein
MNQLVFATVTQCVVCETEPEFVNISSFSVKLQRDELEKGTCHEMKSFVMYGFHFRVTD